jgi:hypothetical protein
MSVGTRPGENATVVIVTVTSGIPSPDPVTITSADALRFENKDTVPYLIVLFLSASPVLAIYLPASGNVIFRAAPSIINGQTTYNIVTLSGQDRDPADTGSHVIIIGSGNQGGS